MATLRNKRALATVARGTEEKHPRNSQSQTTPVPRSTEGYITKVSEEIKGRVIRKLSLEFNMTESCISGSLSKLDEFLFNPQVRTRSGTVTGTFRNTDLESQEPNEDCSRDHPHPEVRPSVYQSLYSNDSDPDETPDSCISDVSSIVFPLYPERSTTALFIYSGWPPYKKSRDKKTNR